MYSAKQAFWSTSFSKGKEAFLLGESYSLASKDQQAALTRRANYLVRFSYIASRLNNDSGWGCVIRSGQMMLIEAFKRNLSKYYDDYRSIINLISAFDSLQEMNYFSLESIVKEGKKMSIEQRHWFTPERICTVLHQLFKEYTVRGCENLSMLHLTSFNYAAILGALKYRTEVYEKDKKTIVQYPLKLLLVFSIRLTRVSEREIVVLQELMRLPCFHGIVGGIKQEGYYFVGYQSNYIFYLDPHCTHQQKTRFSQASDAELNRFFKGAVMQTSFYDLDPSMSLCFLVENCRDVDTLRLILLKSRLLTEDKGQLPFVDWHNRHICNEDDSSMLRTSSSFFQFRLKQQEE